MKCSVCGAALDDSWKFCPVCSESVDALEGELTDDDQRKLSFETPNSGKFIIPGVILAAVLLFVVFSTSHNEQKTTRLTAEKFETYMVELESLLDKRDTAGLIRKYSSLPSFNDAESQSRLALVLESGFTIEAEQIAAAAGDYEGTAIEKILLIKERYLVARRKLRRSPDGLAMLEALTLNIVGPIPESGVLANQEGYTLLNELAPENELYRAKKRHYDAVALAKTKEALKNKKNALIKERKKLLSDYKRQEDKFNDTVYYTHVNSPQYLNSRSTVYAYMGISRSGPFLRMKVVYTADDWLFVDRVQVYANGESKLLVDGDFKRDNNGGTIWEWVDVSPSSAQLRMLVEMSSAPDATIRYTGNTYRKDIEFSHYERANLKTVLTDFKRLKELSTEIGRIGNF